MEMDLLWQQFQNQNEEEIRKQCADVLEGLASFSNLQEGLKNKGYDVLGGHRKFKRDVDIVRQQYEQALRDYEPREIGLVWSNFAKQLSSEENKILEKDDELSVEEKKREKEENAKSLERMKVEMAKGNQKALDKQKKELDEQQKKLDAERERRDKENDDKIRELYHKIASLETNKEEQKKILDAITALQEEKSRNKEEKIRQLKEKHRLEKQKREQLEKTCTDEIKKRENVETAHRLEIIKRE